MFYESCKDTKNISYAKIFRAFFTEYLKYKKKLTLDSSLLVGFSRFRHHRDQIRIHSLSPYTHQIE